MTDLTYKLPPKLKISVVLISLNEQANIERAIGSVCHWVDEVIVLDTGSTDKTVEIAKNLGAKVESTAWLGFGKTKKKATSLAKNSWILSLDCDEEVSDSLKIELFQKFEQLNPKVAYKIPRLSNYLEQWIHHGGWYPDYQIRLFNKDHSNWNEADIHEKVEASAIEKFDQNLNHYVFKDISHHVLTNDKYSTIQAKQMYSRGISFSWFHFLTKPAVKFIECYFIKLGFLDGWVGFFIAKSAAYSTFLKWSKLKVLWQSGGKL